MNCFGRRAIYVIIIKNSFSFCNPVEKNFWRLLDFFFWLGYTKVIFKIQLIDFCLSVTRTLYHETNNAIIDNPVSAGG